MVPELILDPQLKYWVLIPISVVMAAVGLLRSSATFLLEPSRKRLDYKTVRQGQFLKRAQAFRYNNEVLGDEEFATRRQYYTETLSTTEYLAAQPGADDDPMSMMTNPATNDQVMNMLKGNLMSYVPQTLIMGWVNFFFAGFVVMKLPFPLTEGFKGMLQQGINTPNLDVRYVLAILWYFVNLFGLRPVYALLMGDATQAQQLVGSMTLQTGMPNLTAPGTNVERVFQGEAESIQILSHKSVFTGVVDRVVAASK